jgi:hypothetical protein
MPLLNSKLVASASLVTAGSLFLWIIPCSVLAIMAILAGITFVFGVILLAFDVVLLLVVFLLVAYARVLLFSSTLNERQESTVGRSARSFSGCTRNVLMVVVAIVGGLALLTGLQQILVQGIYPLTPLIYPMMKFGCFQVAALCAILFDAIERSGASHQHDVPIPAIRMVAEGDNDKTVDQFSKGGNRRS